MGKAANRKKVLRSSKNESEKMAQAIVDLTENIIKKKAGSWTVEQIQEIENTKNLYGFALTRVRYLMLKNIGYSFEDPINKLPLLEQQKQIGVISDLLFSQLNLISKGWDIVKNSANSKSKEFNFNHPIDFFFEICRQMANADLQPCLSKDINQGDSLTATRDYFKYETKLYRDRLEAKETQSNLHEFENSEHWWRFFLYSIWGYRYSCDLNHSWKEFLKAHKQWVNFNCNKKTIGNSRLAAYKWNHGRPVYAQSSQPIKFKKS